LCTGLIEAYESCARRVVECAEMIPNIFISSTIQDLHHLRDAIRDVVQELGYNPVMSEYGDIGYSPRRSAEDSCYLTVSECQLAVIILGKRYGYISENGLSVTHNEFRSARDRRIPVISLVDHEVLTFKKMFELNKQQAGVSVPDMDNPEKSFGFIDEITSSKMNNALLAYASATDARQHLRRQLAHMFGEFLRGQYDPMKADVKDILAEIRTLRLEAENKSGPDEKENDRVLRAMRFLVDDAEEGRSYSRLLRETLRTNINSAVPILLSSGTFDEAIKKMTGSPPELLTLDVSAVLTRKDVHKLIDDVMPRLSAMCGTNYQLSIIDNESEGSGKQTWRVVVVGALPDGKLVVNEQGLNEFRKYHEEFKNASM